MTPKALVPKDRNLPLSRACIMLGLCQRHMELKHWRKKRLDDQISLRESCWAEDEAG